MSPYILMMTLAVYSACLIGTIAFRIRKYHYVAGSHPRYIMASLERVCAIGLIITMLALAGINVVNRDWGFAVLWCAFSLWELWLFFRRFNDDDHWFNDQWKRLKRGLKKLRQRLADATPLPSPSPA